MDRRAPTRPTPQRLPARALNPIAVFLLLLTCSVFAADKPDVPAIPIAKLTRSDTVDFEREVLPILRDSCLACHNRTRAKADLILETPADILKGGENGPSIVPGKSADSLLLRVAAHQSNPVMPPKDNKASAADLTGNQLAILRLWIDQGAKGEVRGSQSIQWQALSPQIQSVYALALTPDGHYAAVGRGNRIDLYDLASNRFQQTLFDPQLGAAQKAAHRDLVESLAFSRDGTTLVSGGFAEAKVWRQSAPAFKFAVAVPASPRLVACSADAKQFAVALDGWPIEVYDAATGRVESSLAASTSPVSAISFSPDGTKLAVASADRGLRISDPAKGTLLAQTALPADITGLAWAAGGKEIATSTSDGVIRLWPMPLSPAWPAPRELKQSAAAVTALAATADGALLVSASADGVIRQWNAADGQLIRRSSQPSRVVALALRRDGKIFATTGADRITRFWDAAKGTVLTELKGDAAALRELAERDRAQKLATADVAYFTLNLQKLDTDQKAATDRLAKATAAKTAADKAVAENDAAKAKALTDKNTAEKALAASQADLVAKTAGLPSAEAALEAAKLDLQASKADDEGPDRLAFLEAEADKRSTALAALKASIKQLTQDAKPKQAVEAAAKAITAADAASITAAQTASNAATELRLASDATTKAASNLSFAHASSAAAALNLKRTDTALAAAKSFADSIDFPATSLAFSPDNRVLATAGGDARLHLWSAETGLPLETINAPSGPIRGIAFTGDTLLAADTHGISTLTLGGAWSLAATVGGESAPLTDRVGAITFTPDGKIFATGSGEPTRSGQIRLWEVATCRPLAEFKDVHSDAVLTLAFSPDGKLLASGAADRLVKILDAHTGTLLRSLEGHSGHVLGVNWKADGRTLVTCSADNSVRIWDALTGERKVTVGGFGKEANAAQFVGVADQIVAAAADGQVRIINDAGAAVKNLSGAADFLHAGAATPDGRIIAVGGQTGTLFLWRDPAAPPTLFPPPPDKP